MEENSDFKKKKASESCCYLFFLAGQADCGQVQSHGPVPVLHTQGFPSGTGNEGIFTFILAFILFFFHSVPVDGRVVSVAVLLYLRGQKHSAQAAGRFDTFCGCVSDTGSWKQ